MTYHLIVTRREFEGIKESWNKLLKESASDTIFLTWEWQFSWWAAFGGGLYIIAVYENEELVAILPFTRAYRLNYYQLRLIGDPHSDYLDFIIRRSYETQILRFFFEDFIDQNPEIGTIRLASVNERSPNFDYFQNSLPTTGFQIEKTEKICPYISLPESWQDYFQSLSASTRYALKRKQRKLEKEFAVKFGVAEDINEVQRRMPHFIAQHQKVWNLRGASGAFKSKQFREFHLTVSELLFKRGQLQLFYLEVNDTPISSYYVFRYDRTFLYYLSGFEPEFSKYSPSVVLLAWAVKDAIDNGMREFDLLRGEGAYKFKWTKRNRVNITFLIKRDILRVNLYYWCINAVRNAFRIYRGLR